MSFRLSNYFSILALFTGCLVTGNLLLAFCGLYTSVQPQGNQVYALANVFIILASRGYVLPICLGVGGFYCLNSLFFVFKNRFTQNIPLGPTAWFVTLQTLVLTFLSVIYVLGGSNGKLWF